VEILVEPLPPDPVPFLPLESLLLEQAAKTTHPAHPTMPRVLRFFILISPGESHFWKSTPKAARSVPLRAILEPARVVYTQSRTARTRRSSRHQRRVRCIPTSI
jgi:hypothetical protein